MNHDNGSAESETSVTTWFARLKAGDAQAGRELWLRYLDRLVRLGRRKLSGAARRVADEEDVALSAFHGFLRGVEQGRFARLDDREDLWQVLVVLAERKAVGQNRRAGARKRGRGKVVGESALDRPRAGAREGLGVAQAPDREPTPQFAAQVRDELARRLDALQDEQLRRIALAKLEGYTNAEIAAQLQLSLRAVERKLSLIRRKWQGPPA